MQSKEAAKKKEAPESEDEENQKQSKLKPKNAKKVLGKRTHVVNPESDVEEEEKVEIVKVDKDIKDKQANKAKEVAVEKDEDTLKPKQEEDKEMTVNEEDEQETEGAVKKDADTDPKVGSYQNRVKR